MRKYVGLMLIAILALSNLMIIKPVNSEITKPSIPEFTVKLADNSYDIPTTYSIDPYTGVNVTHPGHRVVNRTVELVIKNQPFVSTNIDGWNISFYYNVRIKGHYSEDWLTLYTPTVTPYYAQQNSENTVVSFQISNSNSYLSVGPLSGLPLNAQIDFQVQALIGYVHRVKNASATNPLEMFPWVFEGETSAWSSTQTISISDGSTSVSSSQPTATTTPDTSGTQSVNQSGLDWMQVATVALLVTIAVLLALVVVFLHRRSINKN
ncbi:MAG: hypothetical protein ACM3UY_06705 [Methanocella sp.]